MLGKLLIQLLRINECDWLLEKDLNDDYIPDCVRTIDQPGVTICT